MEKPKAPSEARRRRIPSPVWGSEGIAPRKFWNLTVQICSFFSTILIHFATSHNTLQHSQLHTWQSQLHTLCQKTHNFRPWNIVRRAYDLCMQTRALCRVILVSRQLMLMLLWIVNRGPTYMYVVSAQSCRRQTHPQNYSDVPSWLVATIHAATVTIDHAVDERNRSRGQSLLSPSSQSPSRAESSGAYWSGSIYRWRWATVSGI